MIIFLILGLLLGATAVIFALQNTIIVTVNLFSWHLQGSLAIVLILAMTTGAMVSILISLPGHIKKSFQLASLRRENKKLKEVATDQHQKIEVEKAKVRVVEEILDQPPRV